MVISLGEGECGPLSPSVMSARFVVSVVVADCSAARCRSRHRHCQLSKTAADASTVRCAWPNRKREFQIFSNIRAYSMHMVSFAGFGFFCEISKTRI